MQTLLEEICWGMGEGVCLNGDKTYDYLSIYLDFTDLFF